MPPDGSRTLYVSLDIDWAPDEAIRLSVDLLESLGVDQATFFVTHETPALDLLRDAGYELGIHPNLTDLLAGRPSPGVEGLIGELKRLVPEAVSVRAHGLVRSTWLSGVFRDHGFSHEASLLIPARSGIALRPFEHPDGILQVPHNWGDYHHCASAERLTPAAYLDAPGLKVLNFHPIHLFLNTDCLETYLAAREHTRDIARLRHHRQDSVAGVRDFFVDLMERARRAGFTFGRIADLRREEGGRHSAEPLADSNRPNSYAA